MNKLIVTALASALAFNVSAQSVQEGEKMINYGRFESAQKVLEPLATKDEVANYYLGIAQLDLEKFDAAKATFAKYPESFYNQAGMARVLFAQGNKEEAGKILTAIVDKAKKKEWEKYTVAADAITYSKGGNINDAVSWYTKANEINASSDANTLIHMGDAYLKISGGGGQSMSSYEKAVEKGTNNSLAYSRIGALWYQAQKYDDALKNYESAKQADPTNPLPYHDLAEAYQRSGRYEKALENIQKFLELSDKSIDDQITYANLLFLSKKYDQAQVKIEELQNKGVTKPYLYRLVAYSAYETKDYAKAQQYMQLFYSKQPADRVIPEDYIYSAKIMSALAAADTAKAKVYSDSADYYFNKIVTADTSKNKRELYLQIAEAFKDAKDYNKVGYWYNQMYKDNAETGANDYFNAGLYYYYGKNYTAAAKAFADLRAKYPEEKSTVYWQGRVAAAIDEDSKTGGAVPFYQAFYDQGNEPYADKKDYLNYAYQYMAYYYYNQNNQKDAMVWINRILEIDPANNFATQIKDYYAKLNKPKASK